MLASRLLWQKIGASISKEFYLYKHGGWVWYNDVPADVLQVGATLASKQVGEWNTFEIHVLGQNDNVILNEITVIPKFSGNRLRRGYIEIQNHDAESHVLFRNIRIKDLSE